VDRWRSGALLAAVTSGSSLLTSLSLRADSAGGLGWRPAAAGTLALALLLWPLAARSTRVLTLAAVLLTAELGAHAVGAVSRGFTGPKQLVCCPSADQVHPGPWGALTAHAGWWLVAAQVVAAVLLAAGQVLGRQAVDAVSDAVAALFRRAVRRIALALPPAARPGLPVLPALPSTHARAESTTRRGPPARVSRLWSLSPAGAPLVC
jgi:hypothetical protein